MTVPVPHYRLITAALLLIAYLVLAGYLLWLLYHPLAGVPRPDWNNVLVIFNAIGALATAAIGVLLGVEVQQGNVNSAMRTAEQRAADLGRKDMAIVAALGNLDTAFAGAAASDQSGIAHARATLLAALAAGPAPE